MSNSGQDNSNSYRINFHPLLLVLAGSGATIFVGLAGLGAWYLFQQIPQATANTPRAGKPAPETQSKTTPDNPSPSEPAATTPSPDQPTPTPTVADSPAPKSTNENSPNTAIASPNSITIESSPWSFAEGLARVKVIDKWGYINNSGRMVIYPQFADAGDFTQGLAKVKIGDRWGYIDRTGTVVITPQFANAQEFSQNLAAVQIGGLWGYIDRTGQIVIPTRYSQALPFYEGLAAIQTDQKWGYINPEGIVVINPSFDRTWGFVQGFAEVQVGNRWGYIDRSGNFIIQPPAYSATLISYDSPEILPRRVASSPLPAPSLESQIPINESFDGLISDSLETYLRIITVKRWRFSNESSLGYALD